jgi:LysM repeat protein
MNSLNGVPNQLSPDEVFEQAVARLEAGEPIDAIIASYPTADGEELRDFLTIVQATQQIRTGPIPQPPATRRRRAKQNFLAAAAELRSQRTEVAPTRASVQATRQPAAQTAPRAKAATPTRRQARATGAGSLGSWWENAVAVLQSVFTVRTLRLAPLVLVVAVVLLSTTTLVTVAQSAVPGDLTYSLKQWIRKHELELAPADQRELVRQMQEMELAEDVRRAAMRADTNATIIQAEDTQVFYGRTGRVLRVGGLTVLDRYQPDANQETFEAMTIDGDLLPGALVRLVYQIMPGQSDTVQGVSLTVVSPPDEAGVSTEPQDGSAPAAATPATATCAAHLPDDWVVYQVRPGDNLTFIANRGGITVAELMEVNCLDSETILIGATLFVPEASTQIGAPGVRACAAEVPAGWGEYEVQVGDNLTRIAQQTGATVAEIMEVNCLASDTILIGATLYIPENTPQD